LRILRENQRYARGHRGMIGAGRRLGGDSLLQLLAKSRRRNMIRRTGLSPAGPWLTAPVRAAQRPVVEPRAGWND